VGGKACSVVTGSCENGAMRPFSISFSPADEGCISFN
jgi:hypothetical protein